MLYEVLKHIRNFFPDNDKRINGNFTIASGTLSPLPTLLNGQYVLIEGSALNDGIYTNDLLGLRDEKFTGTVTPLKIPKDFLNLVAEIESYTATEKPTNLVSESFGGYSYSKATNASGNVASWQNAYGTRLNSWRKV